MRATTDALKIIDRMTGHDVQSRRLIAEARMTGNIAQSVYDARIRAGLTHSRLGKRANVKTSTIARIEAAESSEFSIAELHRVTHALGLNLALKLNRRRDGRGSR